MDTLLASHTEEHSCEVFYEPGPQVKAAANGFSPRDVLRSSIGPQRQFCIGYTGQGGYCIAPVISIGSTRETISRGGSKILDAIVAYDDAEVEDTYIGQINMITVSSFCGPQGVIWGYDLAWNGIPSPPLLSEGEAAEFAGLRIINGASLRQSSRMLFGTRRKRHFPLQPGSHVPCAAKYRSYRGPCVLYAAMAIGIPEERGSHACLFMEDVGKCTAYAAESDGEKERKRITLNVIRSILRIGENHGIHYGTVIADVVVEGIREGHVGCALVAAPYFHLAADAYEHDLHRLSLQQWYGIKRRYFVDPYCGRVA
ncbi:MAG: hypothetical protein C4536_15245 [Actinobacteria bacterium]|jgi:histidine decarboxylase|nr:MAG: hypothetical protein C4536_15245 [Actinomycetota bacterium]